MAGHSVLGGFEAFTRLLEAGEIDSVVLNTYLIDVGHPGAREATSSARDVELLRLHVDLKPVSVVS